MKSEVRKAMIMTSIEQNMFAQDELKRIDEAVDLHTSPFREDGKTYGTPTWIWTVVVDGDLYVRAYHGQASRWYKAAIGQRAGRIHAAGMIKEVEFEAVNEDTVNNRIDEAYKKKYGGSPYLSPMILSRSRQATVRITPRSVSKKE